MLLPSPTSLLSFRHFCFRFVRAEPSKFLFINTRVAAPYVHICELIWKKGFSGKHLALEASFSLPFSYIYIMWCSFSREIAKPDSASLICKTTQSPNKLQRYVRSHSSVCTSMPHLFNPHMRMYGDGRATRWGLHRVSHAGKVLHFLAHICTIFVWFSALPCLCDAYTWT